MKTVFNWECGRCVPLSHHFVPSESIFPFQVSHKGTNAALENAPWGALVQIHVRYSHMSELYQLTISVSPCLILLDLIFQDEDGVSIYSGVTSVAHEMWLLCGTSTQFVKGRFWWVMVYENRFYLRTESKQAAQHHLSPVQFPRFPGLTIVPAKRRRLSIPIP